MSGPRVFDNRAAIGNRYTNGIPITDNPHVYSTDIMGYEKFMKLKNIAKDTLNKRQLNYLFNNHGDNADMWWNVHETHMYKNNSYGFRFDNDFKNFDNITVNDWKNTYICLGCSITYGMGVLTKHTWPALLSQELGEKCLNLGVPASGIQTSYRLLKAWVEHFGAAPKGVFILGWLHPRLEFPIYETKNNTEKIDYYRNNTIMALDNPKGVAFTRKLLLEEDATKTVYTNTLEKFSNIKRKYDIDIYRIPTEMMPWGEFRRVTAADTNYIGEANNLLQLKGYGFDFSHPAPAFQRYVSGSFRELLYNKDKFFI